MLRNELWRKEDRTEDRTPYELNERRISAASEYQTTLIRLDHFEVSLVCPLPERRRDSCLWTVADSELKATSSSTGALMVR